MSYAKEFDSIPLSDATPEFHFGNCSAINMWVEFQKSDFSIWRGSFECGETETRTIIEQINNTFIVVSSGIGYQIDNDTSSLISKIKLDDILFAQRVNNSNCLLANCMGFYFLDAKNNLTKIEPLNSIDWIEISECNEKKITGEFESSHYQWKKKCFEFDIASRMIKIN